MTVDPWIEQQVRDLVRLHLDRHPRTGQLALTDPWFRCAVDCATKTLMAAAHVLPAHQRDQVVRDTLDRLLSDQQLAAHDAAYDPVAQLGIVLAGNPAARAAMAPAPRPAAAPPVQVGTPGTRW